MAETARRLQLSAAYCALPFTALLSIQAPLFFFSAAPTVKTMLPVYISGMSFNAIHAVTTLIALFVATPYIQDTFDRIAKKNGLFGT